MLVPTFLSLNDAEADALRVCPLTKPDKLTLDTVAVVPPSYTLSATLTVAVKVAGVIVTGAVVALKVVGNA